MTGFAPRAQNFSFWQLNLVEPAGFGVCSEKILRRGVGDADGPWRGFIRPVHGQVAQNRVAHLVIGHIQEDEFLEISIDVKDLNAAVAAIGDIYVVIAIDADVVRIADMARIFVGVDTSRSITSPLLDPVAVLVELGDARIEIAVAYVNIVVL